MTNGRNPRELNLTTHRAATSVWNRRGWDGSRERLAAIRWLIGIGGAALAVQGIRRRSALGAVMAGTGSTLAWWALTGRGDLELAGRRLVLAIERLRPRSDRVVDESADSFPASDAPSWTPTVGTGVRRDARPH